MKELEKRGVMDTRLKIFLNFKEETIMKNKLMSLVLAGAMVASLGVNCMAAELTADQIAGADTVSGDYNVYTTDTGASGKASSVVVLNAEATTFTVTVPIALHVAQAADGSKTYADDMKDGATGAAKIINENVLGQVKISDVKVVPETNYTISAWDADYANMKVNSKTFGFQINGLNVKTDGSLDGFAVATDTIKSVVMDDQDGKTDLTRVYSDYRFTRDGTSAFPVIQNESVLPITYQAKLPAFSAAVNDANVGAVVFTIDFN